MSEGNGLATALLAFHKEAPDLHKDAKATVQTKAGGQFSYSYLSLDTAMAQIRPLLNKHGLVLLQFPSELDGQPALRTKLIHAPSGEFEQDTMPLLGATDPKLQGSAITYARRYSLLSILALVADEDDDGQKATSHQNTSAAPTTPDPLAAERARLLEIVAELEAVSPVDPALGTWSQNVADYCKEQGWKGGLKALNAEQLAQVTEKFEGYLKAEREAASVPF